MFLRGSTSLSRVRSPLFGLRIPVFPLLGCSMLLNPRGVTYDPHTGVLLHISAQFARILLYTVVGPSEIFVAMYLNGRLCRPEPFAFQLFNYRRTKYLRTNPYSGRPGARSGAAGVLAIILRVQTTTARGWLHPPRPTHILSSFCRRI